VVCFALHFRSVLQPALFPPLGVRAAESGGYPSLIDLQPGVDPAESALEPGDRLLRMSDIDLRGMGRLAFYAQFVAHAEEGRPMTVRYERDGRVGETQMPLATRAALWPTLLLSLGFAFTAAFLSLRAPPSPIVRSVSRAFGIEAIACASTITGGVALNYAGLAVATVSWPLGFVLCLRALLRLLRGDAPASPWARLGPWLFAVMGPLAASVFAGVPLRKPLAITLWELTVVAYCVTVLVVLVRGYRRAGSVLKRQIRWVVLGFHGALTPPAIAITLMLIDRLWLGDFERFLSLVWASFAFAILIPLSVLFAIARYNLFDVDRLLSATASYQVVLGVLLCAGLVAVPHFGQLSSELMGVDPRTGQVALSLLLAAVVVPAHHRLRPRIERLFFHERYALDQGIAELLRALSACPDPRALTQRVGEELDRLLQPEACVVYSRAGEAFAPAFVAGRGVPPAFEAESPLVATLRPRERPLALSDAGRRPDAARLGAFDRAALEALQAEVVVPVRRDASLLAFLCLGPKRSGDVYTATDLSHLTAVAEAMSSQLRRFDQEEVIRAGRAMQERLRRYVPGAVAEQLAGGSEPVAGERRVTVLFVDLRGYTSFAEPRRADEIFSTVNRYTETVSEIVRAHGGAVVEFNGDGMMAVFGAPRELAHKERAAVAAGREIASAVGTLPTEGGADRLSVGVGIATGEAFVGNVRAADRMIWTALGNTTNLAARLQALTRELDAGMVIDGATWRALGRSADDFERHPAVAIRGRRRAEDVYTLPLDGGSGAAEPGEQRPA
jgi:class 3 adenylate cyclase